MMNRKFLLVLTVSLLVLPFTTSLVNNDNSNACEKPTEILDFTTEAFTQKFSGTYDAKAFVGPDNVFAVVNASIHSASTTLYLEVYTLSSQNLIDSLIYAKVTNGVDVIVLLEFDHVSGYEDDYTEQAAYLLDNAGVEVLWTTPDYTFTHAKYWVVDSQYTYVYSGNWAPSSIPADTDARVNREMGLMFDDADIATFYEDIFFEDYSKATGYTNSGDPGYTLPSEDSGTYVPVKANPLELTSASMEVIPLFSPNNSYAMLSSLIENATTTINVQQQYMTETCQLTYDLIDASNSGVDVRVMFPEPTTASKNVTEILIQNGVEVRFSKSLYNHNKFLNVDGEYVSVSSINWSNGSVDDNREAGAIVKNTAISSYLGDVFEYDWEYYSEIPTGFVPEAVIVSPKPSIIADGSFQVEAGFYIGPFTSGELRLDNTLIHTWSNPSGVVTYSLDTTAYSDGIHTLKVTGITASDNYEDEVDFNIINAADWKVLISEIRFDAVTEPDGEFFEIFNAFDFNVDIGGWLITDNEDIVIIPAGTTITAQDMLIFVRDQATFTTEMNTLGITGVTPDFTYSGILLANSGDELIIKDPDGNLLDACVWGSGSLVGHTPWTGSMDDTKSLQRDPANVDTDDCSVDFKADTPDPGTVYISVVPSGFIPGFIVTTTLAAIVIVSIFSRYLIKKRK
ncbi:MAG: hypothetical protein FK730_01530 [Asgard group archaeon]|nr:hypothetical protein [Asgard group archaeon]